MRYLIKSLKWTKNDKVETWYRPNSNGYTTLIANAGIYSEEDRERLKGIVNEKVISFVPLTQKVINKGKRQLKNKLNELDKYLVNIKERYERNVNEAEEEIAKIKMQEQVLIRLQESEGLE